MYHTVWGMQSSFDNTNFAHLTPHPSPPVVNTHAHTHTWPCIQTHRHTFTRVAISWTWNTSALDLYEEKGDIKNTTNCRITGPAHQTPPFLLLPLLKKTPSPLKHFCRNFKTAFGSNIVKMRQIVINHIFNFQSFVSAPRQRLDKRPFSKNNETDRPLKFHWSWYGHASASKSGRKFGQKWGWAFRRRHRELRTGMKTHIYTQRCDNITGLRRGHAVPLFSLIASALFSSPKHKKKVFLHFFSVPL